MTTIIFVRHGQSKANTDHVLSDNTEGFPLTDVGIRQVKDTAMELSVLKVDRIFTSPVLRARQTAAIINEGRGLDVVQDDRLWERKFGKLNGTPSLGQDLPAVKAGKVSDWRFGKYGHGEDEVEPFYKLQARINSFVREKAKLGGTIVAVSHMDTIDALLSGRMGLDDVSGYAIMVPTASMTIISANGKTEIIAAGVPSLTKTMLDLIAGQMA